MLRYNSWYKISWKKCSNQLYQRFAVQWSLLHELWTDWWLYLPQSLGGCARYNHPHHKHTTEALASNIEMTGYNIEDWKVFKNTFSMSQLLPCFSSALNFYMIVEDCIKTTITWSYTRNIGFKCLNILCAWLQTGIFHSKNITFVVQLGAVNGFIFGLGAFIFRQQKQSL